MVAAWPAMVAVGLPAWLPSVEKLTVTVSPTLARVEVALLEEAVTAETTGALVSSTKLALRDVALPAASVVVSSTVWVPSAPRLGRATLMAWLASMPPPVMAAPPMGVPSTLTLTVAPASAVN